MLIQRAILLLILAAATPVAIAAQTMQALGYSKTDPLLVETPTPVSDAEAGSIGCVVASVAVGVSMLYLMGGIVPALAFMGQPLPPSVVLEGSAALAFVFSSACYIGVALAPITVSAYYNKASNQLARTPTRPLFAPGELWAIGRKGANATQQQQPIFQQPMAMPQQQYMVVPQQHMAVSQQQPIFMPRSVDTSQQQPIAMPQQQLHNK